MTVRRAGLGRPVGRAASTSDRLHSPKKIVAPGPTKLELRPVGDLIPYARNARKHSPAQIQKLAESIKEFGFNAPIVIDGSGVILAGHGRLMAAMAVGLTHVPVVPVGHLSDAQRRAYVIADNKHAELATWDEDMLALELAALEAEDGFNLDVLGFSDRELEGLLRDIERDNGVTDAGPPLSGLSYAIVVRCTSDHHQIKLLAEFKAQGLECESLIS